MALIVSSTLGTGADQGDRIVTSAKDGAAHPGG